MFDDYMYTDSSFEDIKSLIYLKSCSDIIDFLNAFEDYSYFKYRVGINSNDILIHIVKL